ncbi:hypothetical protein [Vibrio vulnificus]|uniref:hypothetical protein n=1 Tax=Vibrio vulnificus TaxID=672 RepID=UPI0028E74A9E|nr:hypothetical protein [Vibrio vulnificus]
MPRGIFWFAESFGGEGGLQKVGLCGIHPLTRRYVSDTGYNLFQRYDAMNRKGK